MYGVPAARGELLHVQELCGNRLKLKLKLELKLELESPGGHADDRDAVADDA